jgi:hypothetical protein
MRMHPLRVLGAFCVALFVSLPVAAATVTLGPGGDLQTAIDNAAPGDTILLQAGATFTGNFVVRGTTSGITIRSAAPDSSLPSPGHRTGPVYAAYLPKLQSPNMTGALRIEPGASYITVANVEFLASSNGSSSVIELGYADSRQTTAEQAPHHLVVPGLEQRQFQRHRARLRGLPSDDGRAGAAPPGVRPHPDEHPRGDPAETRHRAEQR